MSATVFATAASPPSARPASFYHAGFAVNDFFPATGLPPRCILIHCTGREETLAHASPGLAALATELQIGIFVFERLGNGEEFDLLTSPFYTFEQHLQENMRHMQLLAERVRQEHHDAPVCLSGFSAGCVVAVHLARKLWPGPFPHGLVLFCPLLRLSLYRGSILGTLAILAESMGFFKELDLLQMLRDMPTRTRPRVLIVLAGQDTFYDAAACLEALRDLRERRRVETIMVPRAKHVILSRETWRDEIRRGWPAWLRVESGE